MTTEIATEIAEISTRIDTLIKSHFNRQMTAAITLETNQNAIRTGHNQNNDAKSHLLIDALLGPEAIDYLKPERRAILIDIVRQKANWIKEYADLNCSRLSNYVEYLQSHPSNEKDETKETALKKVLIPQLKILKELQMHAAILIHFIKNPAEHDALPERFQKNPIARYFFLDFPKDKLGDTKDLPELAFSATFKDLSKALTHTPLLDFPVANHPLYVLMAHVLQFTKENEADNEADTDLFSAELNRLNEQRDLFLKRNIDSSNLI